MSNKSILLDLRSLELDYLTALRKLLAFIFDCLLRSCVLFFSIPILASAFIAYGEGGTVCDLLTQSVLPSQFRVVGQLNRICLLRGTHHNHMSVGLDAISLMDLLVVDNVDEYDVI